jgi:hypothetical protein
VPLLSIDVVPETAVPLEFFSVNETLLGTTAWENVAVGAMETGSPDDPELGVTLVTVGVKTPDAVVYTTSTQ